MAMAMVLSKKTDKIQAVTTLREQYGQVRIIQWINDWQCSASIKVPCAGKANLRRWTYVVCSFREDGTLAGTRTI